MGDIETEGPAGTEPGAEPNGHKVGEHPAVSEHSPWPVLLSLGILIVAIGLLYQPAIVAVGAAVCVAAVIGWLWQPWVS
ncbi:MAG TPA: hypothetical protein VHS06_07155 [Chloroflexota bacterium]|nr:hypothetical protein [Chloroflexota bacterium]